MRVVRSPMQVDDNFRKKIKKIQEEIMKRKGEFVSIPKITKQMIQTPEWDIIEKRVLENIGHIDISINLDTRKR